jgi:fumarylacetoacetase
VSRARDETCDPDLRSWVESANAAGGDFPIQNLPFGVFRARGRTEPACIGVAIGEHILDLDRCRRAGLLGGLPPGVEEACGAPLLNPLMALGRSPAAALRRRLSEILRSDATGAARDQALLFPLAEAELLLPAAVGDYTDFYASVFHATSVGRLFRPENPLLPNYKHVPIAYHGRSSSLVASGTSFHRPRGQTKEPAAESPAFGPSRRLDCELEVGFFVGAGNELGRAIPIGEAEEHIFGCSLVNDWSARDIQAWEYQPLGPFLAKNFATTVSPWVVTLEALAPFRAPAFRRPTGDPEPLPYLSSPRDAEEGGLDIHLEIHLRSEAMRRRGLEPVRLSRSTCRDLYWTPAQMLAHHTSNGCNLRPGDLIASGTVSGAGEGSAGSLLELTHGGSRPLRLPAGEERTFLADGDEVILKAWCEREGCARIGFGECRGVVRPALEGVAAGSSDGPAAGRAP